MGESLTAAARRIAGANTTQKPHQGVSGTDVARDLLGALHPDTHASKISVPAEALKTFQAVTEAQQYKDDVTTQGLYAATVARAALTAETPSLGTLERIRYKAWMALQAGKGRFNSKPEVDEWKEQALAAAPYRARAVVLASAFEVFGKIASDSNGDIRILDECLVSFSGGFEAAEKALGKIMDEDTDPAEIQQGLSNRFDKRLSEVVTTLKDLQLDYGLWGQIWYARRIGLVNQFGESLRLAARALEGQPEPIDYKKLGSLFVDVDFGVSGSDIGLENRRRASILDGIVKRPLEEYPDRYKQPGYHKKINHSIYDKPQNN